MAIGKRRKGKQGTGRPTSVSAAPNPSEENQESVAAADPASGKTVTSLPTEKSQSSDCSDLILTSEKRRGVYECDYCHSDISQLPRIRCAVCHDFDLCLDCFATTDHAAAIARLKAAATAHSELAADGIASTMVVAALSCANHDDTHGYRVCDSTRYPVLGSARQVIKLPNLASLKAEKGNDDKKSEEEYRMIVAEDPKSIWTAEEDLRLLDAIKTHGLGNWTEISDAISGVGSAGKTPKRCMERYFDDFLGRYGHILPQYTIVEEHVNDDETASNFALESNDDDDDDESVRSTKRRIARTTSNVSMSSAGGRARKRYKVVPTESLPGYQEVWPEPYIPSVEGRVNIGQEVARDLSRKNELDFVKAIAAASSQEEAGKIRKEWENKWRGKIGAPTVLPPRLDDTSSLPGSELLGFMPRRGDFDIEHDNDAENAIAEMEFLETDTEQEKELKLKVLQIYYEKQNERERRKQFILSRNLYDYRNYVKNELEIPQDERDLRHRMRLFERFHTPEEHQQFIQDIIKAKKLRKEIAKLQMYRRIGIRSLAEAEKYELDKARRQYHVVAQQQKEAEAKEAAALATAGGPSSTAGPTPSAALAHSSTTFNPDMADVSLWKSYRSSERKMRRSLSRMSGSMDIDEKGESKANESKAEADKNGAEVPGVSKDANVGAETKDEGTGNDEKENMEIDETPKVPKEIGNDKKNFDITTFHGYDLLSRHEVDLCLDLRLYPVQYLEIKRALIQESLRKGLLENEGPGSSRRMVVKMDIKRRGPIVDFMLRAGWIDSKLATVARTVTPPPNSPREE